MTRTLADMTPAERAACVGRWAEWHYDDGPPQLVVIDEVNITREFAVCVIPGVRYIEIPRHRLRNITPRFDLPRAWTPTGEPAPLPKPDRDGRWWPTAASIGSVNINPAGEIVLHSGRFRDMTLHLTPEKATDLADILNAAAVHATQEEKHDPR